LVGRRRVAQCDRRIGRRSFGLPVERFIELRVNEREFARQMVGLRHLFESPFAAFLFGVKGHLRKERSILRFQNAGPVGLFLLGGLCRSNVRGGERLGVRRDGRGRFLLCGAGLAGFFDRGLCLRFLLLVPREFDDLPARADD
jgi:hypothetical protein